MTESISQEFEAVAALVRGSEQQAAAFALDPAAFMQTNGSGLTIEQFNQYIWDTIQTNSSTAHAGAAPPLSLPRIEATDDDGAAAMSLHVHWYGFELFFPHATVDMLAGGSGAYAAIVAGLGGVFAGAEASLPVILTSLLGSNPVGAAIATGIIAKAAEFVAMDYAGGNTGIWLPVSWLQVPMLPFPALAATWIHPIPGTWHD
jgi:hypothetical protein